MKRTFYLTVFAIFVAVAALGLIEAASLQTPSTSYTEELSLRRVMRQIPEPSPAPPEDMPDHPPEMSFMPSISSLSRKRREAKGVGGSIPTRRG